MNKLAKWKKDGNPSKIYASGLVANQAILSRHIAFGGEDSGRKEKRFVWAPQKRRKAFTLHITRSDEHISGLRHCSIKDLQKL
jgi:hypothetical protein